MKFGTWKISLSACLAVVVNTTVATLAQAEPTTTIPNDLHFLIGKHVQIGRMILCELNSYTPNLAYSGKSATVLSFKENATIPPLSAATLSRIPQAMQDNFADIRSGGILSFQFEDGKKLDTCGNQGAKVLASNLELAPGETIDVPAPLPNKLPDQTVVENSKPLANGDCPVVVTKVASGTSLGHLLLEALFVSQFEQSVDRATHGGEGKHYLDIAIKNASEKSIAGVEVLASYANNMGDETNSTKYVSPNNDPINTGQSFTYSAMDRRQSSETGVGDVTVSIDRVRFTDGTFWKDNGSHSCANKSRIE